MKAEKDKKTGKWLIQYRYTDWQGKRRKSTKRGFATKREAEEWLRNFLITQKADFDMKFEDFWKIYCADMETRLREHTMRSSTDAQRLCDAVMGKIRSRYFTGRKSRGNLFLRL